MLTATQHTQREWLNARFHLLEVAGILDRIEKSGGTEVSADPTVQRIAQLLRIVQKPAERGFRAREVLTSLSE